MRLHLEKLKCEYCTHIGANEDMMKVRFAVANGAFEIDSIKSALCRFS
jgi:hypothetical protein